MTALEAKLTAQLAECKATCEKINGEQQSILGEARACKTREHQAADMLLVAAKERQALERMLGEVQAANAKLLSALTLAIEGKVRQALLTLVSVGHASVVPERDYDDDPPDSEP
jgi:hypothetical protein